MTAARCLALVVLALALTESAAAGAVTPSADSGAQASQSRVTAADRPTWQWRYRVWMPPVWQRIARCESGAWPPNWRHDSGTYQGAFGFHHGSWDAFRPRRYPGNAAAATPWQQYRVALRIHARYGFTGWGCYDLAWVRG